MMYFQLQFFNSNSNQRLAQILQVRMQKSRLFPQSLRTSASMSNIFDEDCMRQPPQKIRQNKYTKTFSKLQSIPLKCHIPTLKPLFIQHLYLSHNSIKSLKGIENYVHLKSLNVSYNCLSQIQQLQFIVNPNQLRRIGLKMNKFIYGYQDYVVYKFSNLEKLDDILIQSRQKVQELKIRSQNIANYSIQYFIRINRVIQFMNDLIDKKMIQNELQIQKHSSNKNNLKLLFENITPKFISQVSNLYVLPSEDDFRKLSSEEILKRIQKIIYLYMTEQIDLKCSCRPRIPLQDQIKQTFKQISNKFILRFSARFNRQLEIGLKRISEKIKRKYPNQQFQNWQFFGLLQNYLTLNNGGHKYQGASNQSYHKYMQQSNDKLQKIHKRQINTKLKTQATQKLNQQEKQNQAQKQNQNPNSNYSFHEKINNLNIHKNKLNQFQKHKRQRWINTDNKLQNQKHIPINSLKTQFFFERISIFMYQKNYIEIFLEITCQKIKILLEKYDFLSNKHQQRKQIVKKNIKIIQNNQNVSYLDRVNDYISKLTVLNQQLNSEQHKIAKQKIKFIQNHQSKSKQSTPIQTQRNIVKNHLNNQKIFNSEAMLKSTVVNNSPQQFEAEQDNGKTTPRPFLNRKDSEISFGKANQEEENQKITKKLKNKHQVNFSEQMFQKSQFNMQQMHNQNLSIQQKKLTPIQENISESVRKYKIYQINLLFKVLRGLKIRVTKRKRKQINKKV